MQVTPPSRFTLKILKIDSWVCVKMVFLSVYLKVAISIRDSKVPQAIRNDFSLSHHRHVTRPLHSLASLRIWSVCVFNHTFLVVLSFETPPSSEAPLQDPPDERGGGLLGSADHDPQISTRRELDSNFG